MKSWGRGINSTPILLKEGVNLYLLRNMHSKAELKISFSKELVTECMVNGHGVHTEKLRERFLGLISLLRSGKV